MILFLQGQASQREVIQGARQALPPAIKVYASHHQDRPEITSQADVAWREPKAAAERVDWALEVAVQHGIKVVHAGRKADLYEARREEFSAHGIDLVTGARTLESFRIEDKSFFVQACETSSLRCVPATTVSNASELLDAYGWMSEVGPVCVKPVTGIYGQGFWRLEGDLDPFAALANPDARMVNADSFISLYAAANEPAPMLVMPYLSGDEVSVDIVCEFGHPVAWVGRRKRGLYQTFERESNAISLALDAIRSFGCDGIVNVQTMDDENGVPHLLEINLRYSGGLSYTGLSGINLPGIFAARRLQSEEPLGQWREAIRIKPTMVALPV